MTLCTNLAPSAEVLLLALVELPLRPVPRDTRRQDPSPQVTFPRSLNFCFLRRRAQNRSLPKSHLCHQDLVSPFPSLGLSFSIHQMGTLIPALAPLPRWVVWASLEMAVVLLGCWSSPSRPLFHVLGFMLTLDSPVPARPSRVDE